MSGGAPMIGRIVLYRSKMAPYDIPAVITATQGSLWPEGVRRWEESGGRHGVPPLSSGDHVHLTCFTPGSKGVYQEHDVPLAPAARYVGSDPPPGSWRWPVLR